MGLLALAILLWKLEIKGVLEEVPLVPFSSIRLVVDSFGLRVVVRGLLVVVAILVEFFGLDVLALVPTRVVVNLSFVFVWLVVEVIIVVDLEVAVVEKDSFIELG